MNTALDLISSHPFLNGLAPDALARLSTWARRVQFHVGTCIFAEGGEADRFWLILEGHVKLDAHVPGRGSVVIESLGSGAVLGWSWMFSPHVWQFGATAVEPTVTVEFDGAAVRRLCDDDSTVGYALTSRFMQVVVDRLQATRIRLLDLYGSP